MEPSNPDHDQEDSNTHLDDPTPVHDRDERDDEKYEEDEHDDHNDEEYEQEENDDHYDEEEEEYKDEDEYEYELEEEDDDHHHHHGYDDGDGDGDGDSDDDFYYHNQLEFNKYYSALPVSSTGKSHLEAGNKIILPGSALDQLMDIGVGFPMLFSIENPTNQRSSHCGVLEFTAEEGMTYMPDWMLNMMSFQEGDLVNIKSVTLDRATYIKLQPHSVDFLDIRNPKAALEAAFCGGYSCLTVGDTIMILHLGKKLFIDIIDAKPSRAVCILETDCEVDFAPPLDYKEPSKKVQEEEEEKVPKFVPFSGRARRLNEGTSELPPGLGNQIDFAANSSNGQPLRERNSIVFGGIARSSSSAPSSIKVSKDSAETSNVEQSFKPFTGKKYTLRD